MPATESKSPTAVGPDLLTYAQAAAYLGEGISAKWLKARVAEGEIEGIRLTERRTVIARADLDAFIERKRRAARKGAR
ncbi:MAG: helix-turn-helix domain-containing protein [Actinomycetota bacterium]|nr:helix-turn-helix domain-containing protein [Actinomycetota bacterium]